MPFKPCLAFWYLCGVNVKKLLIFFKYGPSPACFLFIKSSLFASMIYITICQSIVHFHILTNWLWFRAYLCRPGRTIAPWVFQMERLPSHAISWHNVNLVLCGVHPSCLVVNVKKFLPRAIVPIINSLTTETLSPLTAAEQVCSNNPDCANEISQSSHVEHDNDHDLEAEFRWRHGQWSQVRILHSWLSSRSGCKIIGFHNN